MRIQPLNRHVVVARDVGPDMTPGGVILPDAAKPKQNQGVVIGSATGNTVHVNDRVIFKPYTGVEVTVDGREMIVLSEETDVIGILIGD